MSSNPLQFMRKLARFVVGGIQLSRSIDALDAGFYAVLKNVRSYVEGIIQPRPGMLVLTAATIGAAIHTIKRVNDDLPSINRFTRFVGASTSLYADNAAHTALSSIDTGYSGNPLTLLPFRPNESSDSWLYIADSSQQRKSNIDGSKVYATGIAPPTVPPTGINGDPKPTLNQFQFTTIDSGINTASGWSADGTIISQITNGGAVQDSALDVLYDAGSTGWASITVFAPVNSRLYQPGWFLTFNNETVIIDSVYQPVKNTTIASITYDSGNTGLCTITLTTNKHRAQVPNGVIRISSEAVRILDVSYGQDDLPSLRCKTVSNHVVGEAVTGVLSWRGYFINNHVANETYNFQALNVLGRSNNDAPGVTVIGSALKGVSLDLSSVGGRPLQDDDMVSLVLFTDNTTGLNEIQFQFGCDLLSTQAPQNYFVIVLRLSDFNPTTTGTATTTLQAQTTAVQRQALAATPLSPDETTAQLIARLQAKLAKLTQQLALVPPGKLNKPANIALEQRIADLKQRIADLTGTGSSSGGGLGTTGAPVSTPIGIGGSQWVQVTAKIKDIARVGTDLSRGWGNITTLRIQASWTNPTANTITVPANFTFGSMWIGGTFGPDVGTAGQGYLYCYSGRSSLTGARSNPSPPTRSAVMPTRSRVQLVPTAFTDPQVDLNDWWRFGGSLSSWLYLGTAANGAQFNDDFPDDSLDPARILPFTNYQPFPVVGLPQTGTCSINGSTVMFITGSVNANWAPGTEIIINGVSQRIYRIISSGVDGKLEVVANAGIAANVTYVMPAPLIQGQPLPAQWGPFGTGVEGEVGFACGDLNNPGRLYWTNTNDFDSASNLNYLDSSSPSTVLVNGFLLDARAFVFTAEYLLAIYAVPNVDPATGVETIAFKTDDTACSKGLFSRTFLAVAGKDHVYFGSKDGIYVWAGAEAQCITTAISILFPHDGQPGVTTNGYIPPDYTQPLTHQLHYGNSQLRYEYKGTDGNYHSLIYSETTNGWISGDDYNPQVLTSYVEEAKGVFTTLLGGNDGRLYQLSGTGDGSASTTAISCEVKTIADPAGDPRIKKVMGDAVVDADPNGATLTFAVGLDKYGTEQNPPPQPTPVTVAGSGEVPTTIDIASGIGTYARDCGVDITWSSILTPKLFWWDFSYIPKPEDIQERRTENDDSGILQAKFYQGFRIKPNTFGAVKAFKVQADNGASGTYADVPSGAFTAQSNGEVVLAYSFPTPFIAHQARIVGTDANPWELLGLEWSFEPEAELVSLYKTQFTSHGLRDYWQMGQYALIAHISTAEVVLTLAFNDGTSAAYNVTGNANGSNGAFAKSIVPIAAKKLRLVQYAVSSTAPFRLYKRACEIPLKAWGDPGPYQLMTPFGDDHNVIGARL